MTGIMGRCGKLSSFTLTVRSVDPGRFFFFPASTSIPEKSDLQQNRQPEGVHEGKGAQRRSSTSGFTGMHMKSAELCL